MKGTISKAFMLAALLGLATAVPGYSLAAHEVKVNVPFDFNAGNVALPAGEYSVQRNGPTMLLIRDADNQVKAALASTPNGEGAQPAEATVKFKQYGDELFLSAIDAPGGFQRDIQSTSSEREAAEDYQADQRYKVTVDVER